MIDCYKSEFFEDFQARVKSSVYWRITSNISNDDMTQHEVILRLENLIDIPPEDREKSIKELILEGKK